MSSLNKIGIGGIIMMIKFDKKQKLAKWTGSENY